MYQNTTNPDQIYYSIVTFITFASSNFEQVRNLERFVCLHLFFYQRFDKVWSHVLIRKTNIVVSFCLLKCQLTFTDYLQSIRNDLEEGFLKTMKFPSVTSRPGRSQFLGSHWDQLRYVQYQQQNTTLCLIQSNKNRKIASKLRQLLCAHTVRDNFCLHYCN